MGGFISSVEDCAERGSWYWWIIVESVVANVYGMSATADDMKKMKMNRNCGKASINRGEARL